MGRGRGGEGLIATYRREGRFTRGDSGGCEDSTGSSRGVS